MKNLHRLITASIVSIGLLMLLESPALANGGIPMVAWFPGESVPFVFGLMKGVIALAVVLVIETFVLMKYLELSLGRAFYIAFAINFVSTVAGIFFGACISFCIFFFLVGLIPYVLLRRMVIDREVPRWFGYTAMLTLIVGYIGTVRLGDIPGELPRLRLWVMFLAPLVFAFGFTLVFEAWMARAYIESRKLWSTLMRANLYSYAFLVLFGIVFGPNLIHRSDLHFEPATYAFRPLESRIEGIHKRRASNLYLLGFTDNDLPLGKYSAALEIMTIQNLARRLPYSDYDNEEVIEIILDALELPNLTRSARDELHWIEKHISFYLAVKDARADDDIERLNQLELEWYEWYGSGKNYNKSSLDMRNWRKPMPFPVPSGRVWTE